MTKTRKELLALAELAKAATPGPWEFNKDPDDYVCTIRAAGEMSSMLGNAEYYPWVPDVETIKYIAAASPDVILSLLAELDALKAQGVDAARDSVLEEAAQICEKREAVLAQHLPPGVAADYFVRGAESASRRNAQHIRAAMSAQQGESNG